MLSSHKQFFWRSNNEMKNSIFSLYGPIWATSDKRNLPVGWWGIPFGIRNFSIIIRNILIRISSFPIVIPHLSIGKASIPAVLFRIPIEKLHLTMEISCIPIGIFNISIRITRIPIVVSCLSIEIVQPSTVSHRLTPFDLHRTSHISNLKPSI